MRPSSALAINVTVLIGLFAALLTYDIVVRDILLGGCQPPPPSTFDDPIADGEEPALLWGEDAVRDLTFPCEYKMTTKEE